MLTARARAALVLFCLLGSVAPETEPGPSQAKETEEENSSSTSDLGSAETPEGNIDSVPVLPRLLSHSFLLGRFGGSFLPPPRGISIIDLIKAKPQREEIHLMSSTHFPRVEALRTMKAGMQLWKRTIQRGSTDPQDRIVLPLSPKEITKSSCKTLPFNQTVSQRGCFPLSIPNHFCFGHCSSFFVPGSQSGDSRPCSSCAPSRVQTVMVSLQCHGKTPIREMEVTLVMGCQCEARQEWMKES
ncbi:DAN domain family member 5 [Microcaecilia unicolor]|uniref:DAN domain family member 5 n=1 Tax=Microcaecilia unicolor TaxID=1415580 RepID=A0A6P7XJT2_9AMPH|nr:DAN domain family member 5 [Microcaecilia unicolor]